jgi:thymidine kinase
MSTADKLREISMTLQIHKKLERNELLAVMGSLIDLAERVKKLETVCPGRKC